MSAEYSVEEVRAMANRIGLNSHEEVVIEQMLTSHATLLERIKADRGMVPDSMIVLLNHIEGLMDSGILPEDVIPVDMWNAVSMHNITHPPAQAAQGECQRCDGKGGYMIGGGSEAPEWVACKACKPVTTEPAAQGEAVNLGADAVRGVLSDYKRLAAFDADETAMRECLRVFLQKQPPTQPHSPDAADSGRVTKLLDVIAMGVASARARNTTDLCSDLIRAGNAVAELRTITRALAAQGQGEPIGEVRENGVTWFRDNPHAFPIGTRFYTAPAASPAGVPDGWKLVPVEPTDDMLAQACTHDTAPRDAKTDQWNRDTWAFMLAAAPSTGESE